MLHLKRYFLNWVTMMIKALIKKQLLEFFSGFNIKGKDGKGSPGSSKAVMIVLFAFSGITFFLMFFSFAFMMTPLIEDGYGHTYFSVFALLSTLFGVFGSVFLTYNTLYAAKDNDLLLSMPIPSGMILFSRMAGLYLTTLLFESFVSVPAFIVYQISSAFDFAAVIISFLNLFILPFAAISISCVLGFFIGLCTTRIRNKSIITVIISFAFFGIYYFCMMRLSSVVELILMNAESVGEWIKKWLYPVYCMGLGCTGDALYYLIFFFITAVAFAVIYLLLSVTFIKLATVKKELKKAVYKEKNTKRKSAGFAFLKKELLFFKNTPAYILNCALGSVMLVLFSVFFAVKNSEMTELLVMSTGIDYDALPAVIGIALSFIASTNNMTSVSVSLEGKSLWLLKSVPIEVKDIFLGKIMLHASVTGVPLLISGIIALSVLKADILVSVLMILFTEIFMIVCAEAGLWVNILFPKTEWTNITVPIKQSLSAFIGMFLGMFFTLFTVLIWFLTLNKFSSGLFLAVMSGLYFVVAVVLYNLLMTVGKKRFLSIGM